MSEANQNVKKAATLFCGRKVTLNLKAPLNGLISYIIEGEIKAAATRDFGHTKFVRKPKIVH